MLINEREAKMIQAVIDRETLSMDMVSRDIIFITGNKRFKIFALIISLETISIDSVSLSITNGYGF
jgi:transcriptional regulator CtsR